MAIVSIVQQNLPYKIYMKTSIFLFMNEFAFEYEYNCKYVLFSQLSNKKLHWLNEKRFTKILTSLQYKPL